MRRVAIAKTAKRPRPPSSPPIIVPGGILFFDAGVVGLIWGLVVVGLIWKLVVRGPAVVLEKKDEVDPVVDAPSDSFVRETTEVPFRVTVEPEVVVVTGLGV